VSAPPPTDLLAAQPTLQLRRVNRGHFALVGTPPEWAQGWFNSTDPSPIPVAKRFPFLEYFLADAEKTWDTGGTASHRSGVWLEKRADGTETPLESVAYQNPDGQFLIIRRAQVEFEQYQKLLQRTRDIALNHEHAVSEIDKKEVLLHCLAHDLAGPLTSIQGCLDMIDASSLNRESQDLLQICRSQAVMAGHFVRDLLDIFSAELNPFGQSVPSPDRAPYLVETLRQALDGLNPVLPHGEEKDWRVAAETSRLERVFYNLLQNAARYSPKGRPIIVRLLPEADTVLVSVEDSGPGVGPETVGRLFQKFVQGSGATGKAGLGLFFCRITVERWGGKIGYEAKAEGGARFWFRLQRIESAPPGRSVRATAPSR
jgi:signal transduction histidine kinase